MWETVLFWIKEIYTSVFACIFMSLTVQIIHYLSLVLNPITTLLTTSRIFMLMPTIVQCAKKGVQGSILI